MIPISLIGARLTILDNILLFLPLVVFGTDTIKLTYSPSLTLCILPWARLLYNKCWKSIRTWEAEKRLGKELTEDEVDQDFYGAKRDGMQLIVGALCFPSKFFN